MIDQALAYLEAGEVVGVPTDTVYGIAADPQNGQAVARVFAIKRRPLEKSIGLLVSSLDQAIEIVEIPDYALLWASLHWPGPLNLIARPMATWPAGVGDSESLGVRVPDHPVALELLRAAGPLAVTSANRSSGAETLTYVEASSVLGNEVALYLSGAASGGMASTSVDVRHDKPLVLRPGPLDLGI